MKNVIVALLCLAPFTTSADSGVSIDFRTGDDGFVSWNDDLYVPTDRQCNLTGVYVGVEGDDVEINDLDVVFGNGDTQDIRVRQYFREGSYSRVSRLDGGKRCIMGFKIDANTLSRWRGSRAWVTLYAQQLKPNGRIREVRLGTVRIADYFNRREWHGRWDRDHRGGHRRHQGDDDFQICINGICVGN